MHALEHVHPRDPLANADLRAAGVHGLPFALLLGLLALLLLAEGSGRIV